MKDLAGTLTSKPVVQKKLRNFIDAKKLDQSAFEATIAHLEETAQLEREAGIAIGDRRASQRSATLLATQAAQIAELRQDGHQLRATIAEINQRHALENELRNLLTSTSWRITAPMRWLGRLAGRPRNAAITPAMLSTLELRQAVDAIRASGSWRAAALIRKAKPR